MKKKLELIPTLIDSNTSLYELLIMVFPDGLDTIILTEDTQGVSGGIKPSKIQLEILKIAKVCFPPNEKVYVPTRDCLAYNIIDTENIDLSRDFDKVLLEYENLLNKYPKYNGKNTCDEATWRLVLDQLDKLDKKLHNELSHIKNYKELIKTRNMDLFSKSRIEYLIKEYKNIISYIKEKCPELPNNLN